MQRAKTIAVRLLAGLGVLLLVLVALALLFRLPLLRWVLRNSLADAGVTPREIGVTALGPRRVTIAPLAMSWRGQSVRIESVTIRRHRLLSSSLGRIELKGVVIGLDLAALAAPAAAKGNEAASAASAPRMTFDGLSMDGALALTTATSGRELALSLTAAPADGGDGLQVAASLAGSAVQAQLTGHYDLVKSTAEFELTRATFDLADSRAFLRDLAPALAAGWETGGTLTATARGRVAGGALAAEVAIRVRDASAANAGEKIAVDGIGADIVLSDPLGVQTPPGQVIRVASARIGNVALRDAAVRFQVNGVHETKVEAAELGALGGRLSIEPFTCDPTGGAVACVVAADGVRIEEVLALFPDAPAKATGQIDARLPVVFDGTGLHFGVGWLALKTGQTADVRFNAPGLLTGRLARGNPAFATLEGIEAGRMPLRVEELRVELHPAGGPPGRSAQIHIVGRPVAGDSPLGKVTLDLNINGPLESLLNWGLRNRLGGAPAGKPGPGTKVEAR